MIMTPITWNHRYVLDSEIPKIDLNDFVNANPEMSSESKANIRIRQKNQGQPAAWQFPLEQMQHAEKLHINISLKGHNLTEGIHPWSKGLILLDKGMPPNPESRRVICAVMDDEVTPTIDQVIDMPKNNKPVALRIEHHGLSGEFEITQLEIFGVKKSNRGQSAWLTCCLCWFLWATIAAGIKKPIRAISAGIIWSAFAWQIVLPGPWPSDHPLAGSFTDHVSSSTPNNYGYLKAQETSPMINEPKNQSLLFNIKMKLPFLRPIFHGLLFGVPALLLMLCITIKRAVILSSALAIGVELIQIGFGFIFNWLDALDLLFDASGITMSFFAYKWWQNWKCHKLAK